MKVLLVAPDSKLPNLALMKLYAYHKKMGDVVGLNVDDPDRIYVSVIFERNCHFVSSIGVMYPKAEIIAGGPGFNPRIRLPGVVEDMSPFQGLYPSIYSIGRVTSGCIRKCHFCVVPKLEPNGIRYIQHPKYIWKPGTILRLLDDNILALPPAWEDVYNFCWENDVTLHMEYFDVRLITEKVAAQIAALKHHDYQVWFSWDMTRDEELIRTGIQNLNAAGLSGRALRCFVYVHDEKAIPDAKYRFDVLRGYDVYPFIMTNPENRTDRIRRLQRLGCRPAAYKSMTSRELFI